MTNFADVLRSKVWTPNDIADLLEGIVGNSSNKHSADFSAWSPIYGCSGSMTISSVVTQTAMYAKIGKICCGFLAASFTLGGTPSSSIFISTPVNPDMATSIGYPGTSVFDGSSDPAPYHYFNGSNQFVVEKSAGNYVLGASRVIRLMFLYRCTL